MTPRYTDSHKYPHGYFRACDTDINRTFDRIRLHQAAFAAGLPRKDSVKRFVARAS